MSTVPRPLDPADTASVIARAPDGAFLGEASVSRLYGSRAELSFRLSSIEEAGHGVDEQVVVLALIQAIEPLARARGLTRLELDARSIDPPAIEVLLEDARQRGVHIQLSWPTTNR